MGALGDHSSKIARKAAEECGTWHPQGRLIVYNSEDIFPFHAESVEASWVDQEATAEGVADVYGIDPSQVLRELRKLSCWAEQQDKKELSLFSPCRFMKTLFRDPQDRHEPDGLPYRLWIPQIVHEMLLTVGDYREDKLPSEPNEMFWHPGDLAL